MKIILTCVSDPGISDPGMFDIGMSDPNMSDTNMSGPNTSDPNMSDPHVSLEVLGVHGGHGHGTEEGKEYLWKVLGVIAGIYGFFLLEKLFSVLVPYHGHVRLPSAFTRLKAK